MEIPTKILGRHDVFIRLILWNRKQLVKRIMQNETVCCGGVGALRSGTRLKQVMPFLLTLILFREPFAQGEFYREYWATFDPKISNHEDGRWRVNDEELSLHEKFGHRPEAKANGLMLIDVPEDLFQLKSAKLYLELWGEHGKTANKRFFLNGRGPYNLPLTGTEEGNETYSYSSIPLKVPHMVSGANAFQFACDREKTFWGHFIIDNASVRCVLLPEHPALKESGLEKFAAMPFIEGEETKIWEKVGVALEYEPSYEGLIASVDYFARYAGFDDNGDRQDDDWHGFTYERKPVNHLGFADHPPFRIEWNNEMIPNQSKPMATRAIVRFKNGLNYWTGVLDGLEFAKNRNVRMYYCAELPVPFHSRVSREAIAKFYLPEDLAKLEKAQLWIKTWDGGESTIKEPQYFAASFYVHHLWKTDHMHERKIRRCFCFTSDFIGDGSLSRRPGGNGAAQENVFQTYIFLLTKMGKLGFKFTIRELVPVPSFFALQDWHEQVGFKPYDDLFAVKHTVPEFDGGFSKKPLPLLCFLGNNVPKDWYQQENRHQH